ncbi:MAG TPA: MBL fold metallo-hydrolase [Solirubrobacterales bacterium]|nr:MBL fold metallo-hydrolase [Solirubrobacterales bacterium]
MSESAANFERICRLWSINCYVVDEGDALTVIDTGISGTAKHLLAAAERRGKPITRIVLTHGHVDHVGSVDALIEALPDVSLIASRREAKLISGEWSAEPGEIDRKPPGGFPKLDNQPGELVEAGDVVGSLKVIAAPGHTPGQIALLDERDRTLFCGDSMTTIGGVGIPAKPKASFPLPYFATWDRPGALATAKALCALEPARIAPGHGKVVEDPGAQIEKAIEAAS